jgi:uncharacterized membrane protein
MPEWCNGGMESNGSSLLSRVVAVVVLVAIAVIALRLVFGFIAGLISALLWIVVIVALVVAFFWARSTLKSGKRERSVKKSESREVAQAPEDRVAAEMDRINQQLREQGRL